MSMMIGTMRLEPLRDWQPSKNGKTFGRTQYPLGVHGTHCQMFLGMKVIQRLTNGTAMFGYAAATRSEFGAVLNGKASAVSPSSGMRILAMGSQP